MELSTITAMKDQLNKSLTSMVKDFETATGTYVSDINHNTICKSTMGSPNRRETSSVEVTVELR